MKLCLLFILSTFLLSDELDTSFITKYEYGAMLYKNPRGIGCIKCHQGASKEVVLAIYLDKKDQEQKIIVPSINQLTFAEFKKVLQAKKSESLIMPTYFLTNDEIASIYFYIKNMKKQ